MHKLFNKSNTKGMSLYIPVEKTAQSFPFRVVGFLIGCCIIPFFVEAQTQLVGLTQNGGRDNNGTLFHFTLSTGAHSPDYSFPYLSPGANPGINSQLTEGANGKFYGMTREGGASNQGVIFEWNPSNNTYIPKVDFNGTDGRHPYGSLTLSGGKFYGMTHYGGAKDQGVIFEWDPSNNTYTKKVDFSGTDGRNPFGSLTLSEGKFYGMTHSGGASNQGVIFEWDPANNTYTQKVDFSGTDGRNPFGSLTLSGDKFYGMTYGGGASNQGVIFEWNPSNNTYTKKVDLTYPNGAFPHSSLTLSGGKFYGITWGGGTHGCGVLFEWNPMNNVYTKKVDLNGNSGTHPIGSLTLSGGKFYGMTASGESSQGVIFEWNPVNNTYNKKVGFNGTEGRNPFGSLTHYGDKFYGMTQEGGTHGCGVLFEWNPMNNVYTKKVDFNGTNGVSPLGSLTLNGGKFYGMTQYGGASNQGVIFEWDPANNTYTKKVDFTGNSGPNQGAYPSGSLTLSGGKFYGMTQNGGTNGYGVIFEWDPGNNSFTKKVDFTSTNGANPLGSLTLSGGKFYGMTQYGGVVNRGVLFEWDPANNNYAVKLHFNGSNGAYPAYTQLVEYNPCSPPSLTCPGPQSLTINASCEATLPDYTPMVDAAASCGGTLTVTQSPPSGTVVTGMSTTPVTITAAEGALSSTCVINVTKVDNPVVLSLTGNECAPQSLSGTIGCSDECNLRAGNDKQVAVTIPSAGTWVFSLCNSIPGFGSWLYLSNTLCGSSIANNDNSCGPLSQISYTFSGGTYPKTVYIDLEGNTGPASGTPFTLTVNKALQPLTISWPLPAQTISLWNNCRDGLPDYTALATTSGGHGIRTVTQNPPPGTVLTGIGRKAITLTVTDECLATNTCKFTLKIRLLSLRP